ncbi:MAG: DinB family protein [Flavobacteriaceae bacterium]|jgi:uncharacterized damage-inducible protein DinB|nr:DinB family protein [Flavobacteriaceae bacterium]
MTLKELLINEIQQESVSIRKMLSRVPTDKFGWKPHEKSMPLGHLASHIATLFGWAEMVVTSDELDLKNFTPCEAKNGEELLQLFENIKEKSVKALQQADENALQNSEWTLRMGEHIIFKLTKYSIIRTMCFNHLYHHRGQLSVYLRLLDIPVPGTYGPSADEPN